MCIYEQRGLDGISMLDPQVQSLVTKPLTPEQVALMAGSSKPSDSMAKAKSKSREGERKANGRTDPARNGNENGYSAARNGPRVSCCDCINRPNSNTADPQGSNPSARRGCDPVTCNDTCFCCHAHLKGCELCCVRTCGPWLYGCYTRTKGSSRRDHAWLEKQEHIEVAETERDVYRDRDDD